MSKHTNNSTIYTFFPGLCSNPAPSPRTRPRPFDRREAELLEFRGETKRNPYLLLLGDVLPELAGLLLQRLHPAPIGYGGLDWGKRQRCELRNTPGTKKKKRAGLPLAQLRRPGRRPRTSGKRLENGCCRGRRPRLYQVVGATGVGRQPCTRNRCSDSAETGE